MKTAVSKKQVDVKKRYSAVIGSLKKETLMWLLLVPTVLSLIICQWNPVIKGLILSFFKTKGYTAVAFAGLANYKAVLTDSMFIQTLINTVMYVVWSLIIGALPPIIIAILLHETVHGKQTFKVLTYLPAVAPALAVSLIWRSLYSPTASGLLNLLLAKLGIPAQQWLLNEHMTIPLIVLSMTWSGCPGSVLLYLAGLQSVSQDLYEAAIIDGAGIWKRIFKITLPHLAPVILLLTVRQIIGVFQIMDLPLVMTDGGPNNASLSLNLTAYKMAFTYMQVGRSLSLGTVSFVILLAVTAFYFMLDKKFGE